MNKTRLSLGALVVGAVLFASVNVLSRALFTSARLDVTEEQLYTLSDGAVEIARSLEEPIYLDFYFSEAQANDTPAFKSYGKRVRELLEEFALRSEGNLVLDVVTPEPFSDAEDRAVAAGLAGLPVNQAGDVLYFGLVGKNTLDGQEVIPFFDPRNERFLEYDITRLIYTLAHPDKKTVAVLSSLPLEGGPSNNPFDPRGGTPPWQILEQLRSFFDVELLEPDVASIDGETDVLVLVHPKELSDRTRYAIDQFVLRGGRVLAFVDPHCEADRPPTDPSNPMAAMTADRSSGLPDLLAAWGVELVPGEIAADRVNALRVTMGGNQPQAVSHVAYLGLRSEGFDPDDPVISQLASINMAMAGGLRPVEGATTDLQPLIRTSDEAMFVETSRVQFLPDPQELLASYVPSGEAITLAARLRGPVSTAFPDGPPDGPEEAEDTGAEDADAAHEEPTAEHLSSSEGPVNLVVVADADLLDDRFWIAEERLGPILLGYRKTADNGDFVVNTIDNLLGSDAMISVRAGSRFSRPFDRVEEIQRNAEERYLAESKALEQRLRDTEAKINDLQREKGAGDSMILSPEQVAEIDRFEQERIETRKQLRDVQHNLRKDIERLGKNLKLANILGTPLLFSLVVLVVWRARRR